MNSIRAASDERAVTLPEVKWRCAHCGAAFQEPRGFRVDGKVEIALMCHRCRKLNHLRVEET